MAGVSLSAILGYSVITEEDCSGFICMPTFPHRVHKSEGGEILGKTDQTGLLVVESRDWSTSKLTAKDLSVQFFTNATIDVSCSENQDENIAGFVELLPQWIDGKLTERDYDCSNLEFKEGDEKVIKFKCKSNLTMHQIQEKIDAIKAKCE